MGYRCLTDRFLDSVATDLAFLRSDYGAASESTSEEWLARVSYIGADFRVDLSYGDRELYFGTIIGRRMSGHSEDSSFALWEWLDALDVRHGGVDAICVDTQEKMDIAISQVTGLLRTHLPAILAAPFDVVMRMAAARNAHHQAETTKNARDRQTLAAGRAARAFRDGDFRLVVSLLEPFEVQLSPAEIKTLQLARQRVGSC